MARRSKATDSAAGFYSSALSRAERMRLPRARALSGVALEMELHPLLQRVRRKRLVRTAAYKRRNELILRILEQRTGERYLPVRQQIVWGPVLPQDRGRLVREEQLLVSAGIHSRRTAMEALGVADADDEMRRVREER